MAVERTKEKAIEGLLKRRETWPSLQAEAAACPEPETLAAYYERSFSAEEMRELDAHFSTCERCQQQLALLTQSEPAPAASAAAKQAGFSGLWNWRWLAPAAAAVVVFAVWVAVQPPPIVRVEVARGPEPKAVATAPAAGQEPAARLAEPKPVAAASSRTGAASTTPPGGDADQIALADAARVKDSPKPGAFAAPAAPTPALANEGAIATPSERDRIAANSSVGTIGRSDSRVNQAAGNVASEEKANRTLPYPVPAERREAPAQEYATRGAYASAQSRAQAPETQQKVEVQGPQKVPVAAAEANKEQAAPAAAPAQAQSGAVAAAPGTASFDKKADQTAFRQKTRQADAERYDELGKRTASGYAFIPSPQKGTLWRAGTGGSIDVSHDLGKTWQSQVSPVDEDLLAGASPAKNLCWVVGKRGTVLLTTDGRTWQKLAAPADEDLISVQAKDAAAATVSTRSGRTFATSDGGRTWRPR
jgi:hypothetical protein